MEKVNKVFKFQKIAEKSQCFDSKLQKFDVLSKLTILINESSGSFKEIAYETNFIR